MLWDKSLKCCSSLDSVQVDLNWTVTFCFSQFPVNPLQLELRFLANSVAISGNRHLRAVSLKWRWIFWLVVGNVLDMWRNSTREISQSANKARRCKVLPATFWETPSISLVLQLVRGTWCFRKGFQKLCQCMPWSFVWFSSGKISDCSVLDTGFCYSFDTCGFSSYVCCWGF